MRTVGVDLSADARGTGIAVIDWDTGGSRLNAVGVGADDAVVLAALDNADRAAVDCPLVDVVVVGRRGRPAGVHAVAAACRGHAVPPLPDAGSGFRTLDPPQDALPTTWAEVGALTAPIRRDGESRSDQSHSVTAGPVAEQDE